jgi:hypothetical protein
MRPFCPLSPRRSPNMSPKRVKIYFKTEHPDRQKDQGHSRYYCESDRSSPASTITFCHLHRLLFARLGSRTQRSGVSTSYWSCATRERLRGCSPSCAAEYLRRTGPAQARETPRLFSVVLVRCARGAVMLVIITYLHQYCRKCIANNALAFLVDW